MWIKELFDGRLLVKELTTVTLYLNYDKNLGTLLGFIDKKSKEERNHQLETFFYVFTEFNYVLENVCEIFV